MRPFLKELKFPSTEPTYIKNITAEVIEAVEKSKVEQGFVMVHSKHTTLGVIVQEVGEPNLLEDMILHTLKHVCEDCRSTKAHKDYPYPTTSEYKHYAQDHPRCDEIDDEYDAAAHIRAMLYSHPSVILPINNGKVDLGKYQEIAIMEFDGRDGKGKNPIRQRTVQIWIFTAEEIQILS